MIGSRGLMLFGSTGSIGTQVLDVVREQPERYHVVGLTAHSNAKLLVEQVLAFRPQFAALSDGAAREQALLELERHGIHIPVVSDEELPAMLGRSAFDIPVMAAASTGLMQITWDLLRSGLPMAIASKELLIALGDLLEPFREQLRPIDSELSAVWQCLAGEDPESAERIILTASGGPFRTLSREQLTNVTVEQALRHPSWKMGPKVTVDSATLFNKALELAETHVLFGLDPARITAVQHPQSVVHALVEYRDGTTRAVLYRPDMHVAIAYALSAPDRLPSSSVARLHPETLGQLLFEPIDSKFEAFTLGRDAQRHSARRLLMLIGADEVAVSRFLGEQGTFGDIVAALRETSREEDETPLAATVQARIEAIDRGRQIAARWYEARYGTGRDDQEGA